MQYLYLAVIALPIMLLMDAVWLGFIIRNFYQASIGHLMAPSFSIPVAAIFYVVFAFGLAFFAIAPGIAAKSVYVALGLGLFFGFLAYATYDLTNLATLKNWPLSFALVDMAWGAFISGTTAAGAYLIATRFFGF